MKFLLISALLCIGLAHGANVRRLARDQEAIIPSLVEEILKVEIQSELQKNSEIEAIEEEPVVKTIKEEIVVAPVVSRTVAEGAIVLEEKMPAIVEIMAVKEEIPEPIAAVLRSEPLPEIKETVEIIAIQEVPEKPVDSFRTESMPMVEQPMEIIKEIVSEIRQEPALIVEEKEFIQPMLRNVIKEEIPQVEELRHVVVAAEKEAVKELIPEPIASSQNVEPVVQVEQLRSEPVVKEIVPVVKAVPEIAVVEIEKKEIVPEKPEIVEEKKVEEPMMIKSVPVIAEIIEKIEFIPEVKKVPEVEAAAIPEVEAPKEPAPIIDDTKPETRQTLIDNIQTGLTNFASNIPIIQNLVPRPTNNVASDDAAADETATRPPGIVQTALNNIQNTINSAFNPSASNAGEQAPNPFANVVQNVQNTFNGLFRPATPPAAAASSPVKDEEATIEEKPMKDEKPVKTEKKPLKDEEPIKTEDKPVKVEKKPVVQAEKIIKEKVEEEKEDVEMMEKSLGAVLPEVVVDPVVVQKEVVEPQKVVEEEKDNLVKKGN